MRISLGFLRGFKDTLCPPHIKGAKPMPSVKIKALEYTSLMVSGPVMQNYCLNLFNIMETP